MKLRIEVMSRERRAGGSGFCGLNRLTRDGQPYRGTVDGFEFLA